MTTPERAPWTGPTGSSGLPLEGLRVLDFSTLLPGPLATLMLDRAGATVVKVERPEGDGLRDHPDDFAMLNDGKRFVTADLKDPADREEVWRLVQEADVLVEQFRPGVMGRLGLGYDEVAARNPALVYCSVTGYGQTGPRAMEAGHDLNYLGASGMLSLLDRGKVVGDALPPGLVADVGGGSYPAVINILLALLARIADGCGRHLDVAMADNLFPFMYWSLACDSQRPGAGGSQVSGASPRYNTYLTRDGRLLLVAALEPQFWVRFCDLVDLPNEYRAKAADPEVVIDAVAAIARAHTGAEWEVLLADIDCSCSVARTAHEARTDPAYWQRGVFSAPDGTNAQPVLPLPLDQDLIRPETPKPERRREPGAWGDVWV